MSVYVDDMLAPARVGGGRLANWSHLFADTHDELETFGRELRLARSWIQHPGTHREHYDVTATVRAKALALGAVSIAYPADVAELLDRRRELCQCKTLASCTWALVSTLSSDGAS